MGLYLTPTAVKWSVSQLRLLPKNQTALFFFLILARCPAVDRTNPKKRKDFEEEFYRYFGGPIKGGGTAVYDPFGGEWRAEEYINSTVYGRLLVGSHKWTEGEEAFFQRIPSGGGWPALFNLTDYGFDNLKLRAHPPCLRFEHRLRQNVIAIYYYRFEDLSGYGLSNQQDLLVLYKNTVIADNPRLSELFREGPSFIGSIFRQEPLSEYEKISCYPTAPFSTDVKHREFLYANDLDIIKSKLNNGETVADYVHRMLWREKQ